LRRPSTQVPHRRTFSRPTKLQAGINPLTPTHPHPEGFNGPTVAHPQPRRSSAGDSIKVLLARADSDERAALAARLRDEGYEVREVATRGELGEYFGEPPGAPCDAGRPDLFISDADLLAEPGAAVLAQLRKPYQQIPVILLSESFDEETLRKAGTLGAAYLFDTPSDDAVVLAALALLSFS
jgi:CheY-like chemotaxis protein